MRVFQNYYEKISPARVGLLEIYCRHELDVVVKHKRPHSNDPGGVIRLIVMKISPTRVALLEIYCRHELDVVVKHKRPHSNDPGEKDVFLKNPEEWIVSRSICTQP